MLVKELVGRLIPACFPGAIIQVGDGFFHLVPGNCSEIRAFRKKLTKQPVGVLIDATLPRGIRMGKVGGSLQGSCDCFMFHELGAIIKGQGFQAFFDGTEQPDDSLTDGRGGPAQDPRADRIE